MEFTEKELGEVLTSFVARADSELLALDQSAMAARWYWRWDDSRSVEWNMYKFSDMLELHKRSCRKWEEHHNGGCCVVERVRGKYVMPRVREFLDALAAHNAETVKRDAIKQSEVPCTWTFDDYEYSWNGTCEICWTFVDGGPKENDVSFCPKCGKPIEVAVLQPHPPHRQCGCDDCKPSFEDASYCTPPKCDSSDTAAGLRLAIAALKRIASCEDAPDIDANGEGQKGLYCGVEDRDCRDRYDGADYGHAVGVSKGLDWASSEAKEALSALENPDSNHTKGQRWVVVVK